MVRSLDPAIAFSAECTTVTVNAHGCGIITPGPLASGTRVELEIVADKQKVSARVLDVVPLNDEKTSWLLGLEMEQAGNFWGIKYAPADWVEEESGKVEPEKTVAVAIPATRSAAKALPNPKKEIPEAVLKRLLAECRLAAISVGGCYLQTGTTFPLYAPVKISIRAAGTEHSFQGSVRVEHVGAGMGIEFSGRGDEHRDRVAKLIEALAGNDGKIPEVEVGLSAPAKTENATKVERAERPQYDSLLSLILIGSGLKRSDFLRELEKQRRHA